MSPGDWLRLLHALTTSAERIAGALRDGGHDDLELAVSDSIDDITDEVGLPVSDEVERSLATVLVWLGTRITERPRRRAKVDPALVRQLRGEVPERIRRHIAAQRTP